MATGGVASVLHGCMDSAHLLYTYMYAAYN